jgi:16S rRNA (adenine1518-N6/adenine1519-N6)-dimethyltransferase
MTLTITDIKEKLAALGIQPKKSLGQNFLISEIVINKIISKVEQQKAKKLIEVGPGLGALTESLLSLGLPLTVLELDSVFAEEWRKRAIELGVAKSDRSSESLMASTSQLEIAECDALRWESWGTLPEAEATVLVSNLPYQISSSIVIDRSIEKPFIKAMVLMFQKEVAQRIMARHKTESYGLLSVIAQTFWDVEKLVDAGPKDFFPPPQIASRVLYFKRKDTPIVDPKRYLKWVKAGFAHRRKLLKSNLGAVIRDPEILIEKMSLNPQCRAEELTVAQWIELYNSSL